MQSELKKYEREIDNLQYKLSKQKSRARGQNERYEQARVELENVANLLDLREREMEEKMLDSEATCARLTRTVHDLEEEVVSITEKLNTLISYNHRLNGIIENDMVPVEELTTWKLKYEKLQESVSTDMVSIDEYESVVRKLEAAKTEAVQASAAQAEERRRQADLVPREQLRQIEERCADLVERMERDMVPREKHRVLKRHYQRALEDLQHLRESASAQQEGCDEAEARASALWERVDSSEAEIRELHGRLLQMEQRNRELTEELAGAVGLAASRGESEARLQEDKAALLVQLGNAKAQLAKEVHTKGGMRSAVLQRKEAEVALLRQEIRDMASQHEATLRAVQVRHDDECRQLRAYCLEWKGFVETLQAELAQDDTGEKSQEGVLPTTIPMQTSAPANHTSVSETNMRPLDCNDHSSSSHTGRAESPLTAPFPRQVGLSSPDRKSAPPCPPPSALAPLLRRLEQQERELSQFCQSTLQTEPTSPIPWNSKHALPSNTENCSQSPPTGHSSPSTSQGKEVLLRSLQKKFDSTVRSSSQFLNERLANGYS